MSTRGNHEAVYARPLVNSTSGLEIHWGRRGWRARSRRRTRRFAGSARAPPRSTPVPRPATVSTAGSRPDRSKRHPGATGRTRGPRAPSASRYRSGSASPAMRCSFRQCAAAAGGAAGRGRLEGRGRTGHPRAGRTARHRRPARKGGRGGGRHRRGPYEQLCRSPRRGRATGWCPVGGKAPSKRAVDVSLLNRAGPGPPHRRPLTVDRGHEFAPGSRPSRTTGRPRPLLRGPLPLAARHQ